MRRNVPAPGGPSVSGVHLGRPFWLWLPSSPPPWPAMIVLHGAGSAKENHADFARMCQAGGWAAIAYDQRGHGEASDEMGPGALADVAAMASFLGAHDGVDPERIVVRGSSMGGFMAIHSAATATVLAGAIAICPAGEEHLLRGLRSGELQFRAGTEARAVLAAWLGEHDLREAAELMGAKPLILLHARGDERIPSEFTEELARRKPPPVKTIIVPGGHHRSVQHDAELQAVALDWIAKQL